MLLSRASFFDEPPKSALLWSPNSNRHGLSLFSIIEDYLFHGTFKAMFFPLVPTMGSGFPSHNLFRKFEEVDFFSFCSFALPPPALLMFRLTSPLLPILPFFHEVLGLAHSGKMTFR